MNNRILMTALTGAVALTGGLAGCSSKAHPAGAATDGAHGSTTTSAPSGSSSGPAAAPTVTRLSAHTEAWQLPASVSRPVVVPSAGGFVVLGGLAAGDVSTDRIVTVNTSTGQSQLDGSLALAVHDSAGAVLGGQDVLFGGGSYSTVSDIQAWSAGTAVVIGHLPTSRSDVAVAQSGQTAYVIGGFDGTSMTPAVLATTDGTTFRTVAQLEVPVRYAAVAVAGGYVWVLGGVTSTSEGGTEETDAIQRVDPTTGTVTVVGHLPQPMGHSTAVVLDGQVFMLGGRSGQTPSATVWRLDQARGQVVAAGTLPQAQSDGGSVVVDGMAYLVGGEVSGPASPLDTVVALKPS